MRDRKNLKHSILTIIVGLIAGSITSVYGSQKTPPIRNLPGISAYVIAPNASLSQLPAGWQVHTKNNFLNCILLKM